MVKGSGPFTIFIKNIPLAKVPDPGKFHLDKSFRLM